MAVGAIGDVVTFAISGTTQAGVIIGQPDGTHALVAYDFHIPVGQRPQHTAEYSTTSITKVSSTKRG